MKLHLTTKNTPFALDVTLDGSVLSFRIRNVMQREFVGERSMILDLFPLKTGIWALGMDAVFDQGLYEELLQLNARMQTGDQIWERKDHNIFDGHSPRCQTLQAAVLSKVQELLGPNGRVVHVQGREVVRVSGVEIMPHNDEDECDVQAVYFPFGPELGSV